MKIFVVKSEQVLMLFLCLFILGGFYTTFLKEQQTVMTMMPTDQKVIVIDVGHGGWDPGRTGTQGENEKDINLKIALKLQNYLEQSGSVVLITRNEDEALDLNKKIDMKKRKEIINDSQGDMMISIHQNSFPSSSEKGSQVFYYKNNEEGKELAQLLQERLKSVLDPDNKRQAKENSSYYILKNTKIPSAIVECGFLTHPEEEKLLNTEEYQEKVAWAIYLGIIDYFQEQAHAEEAEAQKKEE